MPMYGFKCEFCGAEKEYVFRRVEDRNKEEVCDRCDELMTRQITGHKTKPYTPHFHHQLGVSFNSMSEEKAYAKKNGLVNISGDFGKTMTTEKSFTKGYKK